MEAFVSRWPGGENNGWREMEDWDELDQGSCWDWDWSGSAEKETNAICHTLQDRPGVYLSYAHAMTTNFGLRQCCHCCSIYTSRRAEDGTVASILNAWAFVPA